MCEAVTNGSGGLEDMSTRTHTSERVNVLVRNVNESESDCEKRDRLVALQMFVWGVDQVLAQLCKPRASKQDKAKGTHTHTHTLFLHCRVARTHQDT